MAVIDRIGYANAASFRNIREASETEGDPDVERSIRSILAAQQARDAREAAG
jgi:hypothetical protein